jgi:hypothetical protein
MADNTSREVSRRSLLVGTAGAAGLAWAAPAITTLGGSAFAGSSVCSGEHFCPSRVATQCGASGPDAFCYCDTTVDGKSMCVEDYFCYDTANHPKCTHDRECPAGWGCVINACDNCGISQSPQCQAPCGTNVTTSSSKPPAAVRRASGR